MGPFLVILLISQVLCVDRTNFRTCSESSFCTRQRNYWPTEPQYSVDVSKLRNVDNVVEFQVINKANEKRLTVNISYHDHHTFRFQIDETDPIRSRFRTRVGDALAEEPQALPLKVNTADSKIIVSGLDGDRVEVTIQPFKLAFFSINELQMTFNDRDLLNFEHQLEPQFIEPPPVEEEKPEEKSAEDGTPTENETNENTGDNEVTQPPPSGPIPVDWSETFKGHRDSRPHGPTSIGFDFTFHGCEHVYGIPEHADSFSLRNTNQTDPYRLYNLDVFEYELNNPMALYGSVPVMWAHRANFTVGVFVNNPTEAWIDVESSREVNSNGGLLSNLFVSPKTVDPYVKTRWMFETGVIDVFVMLAQTPLAGLQAYAALTGVTSLPPLFSLAHHQSRWNYRDQAEVKLISDEYNRHNMPVDVIWLDIEHADDKRYFKWNKANFPDADAMIDDLAVSGRKLVVVVDPHIKMDHSWQTCQSGKSQGLYVKKASNPEEDFDGWCWPGSSYWPDFYRPEVVDWWANLFTDTDFVSADRMYYAWNDMNEPSVFSGPEVTIPKDTLLGGQWENRDLHNLYSLWVHNASWEGLLRRSGRKERPFVLTRAFFAGSQRTSAAWTGDNTASWDHLRITTPMLLSMSMAGITFCGADVGGFFGHPSGELYARWYQAGAFHPFLRSHAHIDTPKREPWNYPQPYFDAIRDALRLRYSLLPYWYTLFARSERNALPPMAPLWLHFPHEEALFGVDEAFMVGEALLVHPVVHEGATAVTVRLPSRSTTWFLHGDWKMYTGGKDLTLPVTIQTIPLFYRGGYIIPQKGRPRRSSAMMVHDPYTLLITLDTASPDHATGFLYSDDYHSTDRSSARLYRMDFNSSVLRFTQLDGAPAPDGSVPFIERVVVMGAPSVLPRPRRVFVKSAGGGERDLEFVYTPSTSTSSEKNEVVEDGSRAALLVIRKPEVRAQDGWQLHVV